jgi:hypothetical protein
MALIGISIAIHPGNADHPGTAPGYVAFGSLLTAGITFAFVGELTSRLAVTDHGLTWRYWMRTKSVAWADIQDVIVMPAASFGPWCSPGVRTAGRLMRINSVIGPRRYTEKIVTAIRETRSQARNATPTDPPMPFESGLSGQDL